MSNETPKRPLSSFETGVISALASIRLYLESRQDWDEKELLKHVKFFVNSRPDTLDKEDFELPLSAVGAKHVAVIEAIEKGVGKERV